MEVVAPRRDALDACLCFPSMPDVMKLNKLGTFDLTKISGGPLGNFAAQIKEMSDMLQAKLQDLKQETSTVHKAATSQGMLFLFYIKRARSSDITA